MGERGIEVVVTDVGDRYVLEALRERTGLLGGEQSGHLIYLKASMTGHEETSILQYKSTHALFPHESTGDQFYGEDQFESYRRLGREVALDVFGDHPGVIDLVTVATGLLDAA